MLLSFLKLNKIICRPFSFSTIKFTSNVELNSQQTLKAQTDLGIDRLSALLENYGFNYGQINRILKSPVSVTSFDENDILYNLTYWLKYGMKDKLLTTLCAYPELLTLNPAFIDDRHKELMTLFAKNDIHKLLVTCPSVFLDDFSHIYDKVEYITHIMGFEQKSIVKSRALQFNLDHIKCRHLFMTYAGKFSVNKRLPKTKNPPLNKIFSRNMETFLNLTKLSEEEFRVFCVCYNEEFLEFHYVEEIDDEDEEDIEDDE